MAAAVKSRDSRGGAFAIVVGGGQGIGFEIAARHLELGFKVAILGRNAARLRAAAELLHARDEAAAGRITAHVCDAARAEQVAETFACLVADYGQPRLCHFLAGRPEPQYLEESPTALFSEQISANYLTAANCLTGILPQLSSEQRTGLMFASSFLAMLPLPGFAAYTAAKAAVLALARSSATELSRRNITTSCLVPTAVDTPGFAVEIAHCSPELATAQLALPLLDARKVARIAVAGALAGKSIILASWQSRLLQRVVQHWPGLTEEMLHRFGTPARGELS